MAQETTDGVDAAPDSVQVKAKRERKKQSRKRRSLGERKRRLSDKEKQRALDVLEDLQIAEKAERKGRGLSQVQTREMHDAMRLCLVNAVMPRLIIASMVQKFGVTVPTAQKHLDVIRREALRSTGYYRVQIQEICQKNLVEILQDAGATRGDRIAAIRLAHGMFDLKQQPEEKEESEEEAVQEAMRRLDEMDDEELDRIKSDLFSGNLDPKALYAPLSDVPRKKVRRR